MVSQFDKESYSKVFGFEKLSTLNDLNGNYIVYWCYTTE